MRERLAGDLTGFGWYADRWNDYYLRKIAESQVLTTAERESSGNLSRALVRLKVERLRRTLPIIIGTLAIIACGIALDQLIEGIIGTTLLAVALVVAWFIEFLAVTVVAARRREYRLVYAFYHLVQYIELNSRQWPDLGFRGSINEKLEEAARALERLPGAFRLKDSFSTAEITKLAQRKAVALRKLKSIEIAGA